MFYFIIIFITIFAEYFFFWSLQKMPEDGNRYLWDTLLSNNVFLIDLLHFALSHLFLQLLIILYVYAIGQRIYRLFNLKTNKWVFMAVIYLFLKLFIYYLNALLYPKSTLILPLNSMVHDADYVQNLSLIFFSTLTFILLILVGEILYKKIRTYNNKQIIAGLTIVLVASGVTQVISQQTPDNSTRKNIIFIGVDSVSWRQVEANIEVLPTFSRLIKNGYTWNNTITPLARTFPAWTSILTGEYPKQHGALFNLTPEKLVSKDTLAFFLKEQGYYTVYAQDERRFNNIDENYGFDRVIGPAIGAADFILPTFADHPVANITYDTMFGDILFPFIALNRASSYTYSPARFVKAIDHALNDNNRPLFLAAHFCLTHIPYTWSTSSVPENNISYHLQALIELDKQLQQLLNSLEDNQVLDNAVVVLFSDHGEQVQPGQGQVMLDSNNQFFASLDNYQGKTSRNHEEITGGLFKIVSGHGGNLNSRSQYNSFMVFNNFGSEASKSGINNTLVSLTNMASTTLQMAGINTHKFGTGLFNHADSTPAPIYLETGFSISAISNPELVNFSEVLDEAVEYYQISDAGNVEMKPELLSRFEKTKHKGVIWADWMYYNNQQQDILINLQTGQWSYDLSSSFAKNAPLMKLQTLLTAYRTPPVIPHSP